ncbi:MAG: hypothetical protein OEX02_07870, partial [Cyclobacteriaceae bacterium]|nr:hypothetical protein [Cyclobacteriaceae bacterium]
FYIILLDFTYNNDNLITHLSFGGPYQLYRKSYRNKYSGHSNRDLKISTKENSIGNGVEWPYEE